MMMAGKLEKLSGESCTTHRYTYLRKWRWEKKYWKNKYLFDGGTKKIGNPDIFILERNFGWGYLYFSKSVIIYESNRLFDSDQRIQI